MSEICAPAIVYLVLAILLIIGMIVKHCKASTIIVKAIFLILWTWFLNFLCNQGYSGISWFLVILPFVVLIGYVVVIYEIMLKVKHNINNDNLAYNNMMYNISIS